MWIDDIEPHDNVYDDSDDIATRVPYMEVHEVELRERSCVRLHDPLEARMIAEYLRQFDVTSQVTLDENIVIYTS